TRAHRTILYAESVRPKTRGGDPMPITTVVKRLALAICLILTLAPYFAKSQSGASAGGAVDVAPRSDQELRNLVSPIALYPDPLVAQILAASTFPDEVAVANYWLQEHKNLKGQTLMRTVNDQQWDGSVKALTQFPSVLQNMSKNLTWTSTLGEAYH